MKANLILIVACVAFFVAFANTQGVFESTVTSFKSSVFSTDNLSPVGTPGSPVSLSQLPTSQFTGSQIHRAFVLIADARDSSNDNSSDATRTGPTFAVALMAIGAAMLMV